MRDQPFDYYERANAELNLIADGAQWDNGAMGTVHFGDEYISARLCEDDYAQVRCLFQLSSSSFSLGSEKDQKTVERSHQMTGKMD